MVLRAETGGPKGMLRRQAGHSGGGGGGVGRTAGSIIRVGITEELRTTTRKTGNGGQV
jgi:hypothetical protein